MVQFTIAWAARKSPPFHRPFADALEFNRGFKATFLTKEVRHSSPVIHSTLSTHIPHVHPCVCPQTGTAIKARMDRDGAADLKSLTKDYKIFKPPSGLQQVTTVPQDTCLSLHLIIIIITYHARPRISPPRP